MIRARLGSTRSLLVAGYGSGATTGRNLGSPGYSYDFVVQLFAPLFQNCGEFELVENPEAGLLDRVNAARQRGLNPIFLCFRGLHDVVLTDQAPTLVVPAWEFPDVPDHVFAGNPRNNWVQVANDSAGMIVHGEFTRDAFVRSGVRAPISVVAVPTPTAYFETPAWDGSQNIRIERSAIILEGCGQPKHIIPMNSAGPSHPRPGEAEPRVMRRDLRTAARGIAKETYKRVVRPLLPAWIDAGITAGARAALMELFRLGNDGWTVQPRVDLSGVVYTSIFNPADGRKNWEDLLSAFLIGLQDCADATLVLKLIGRDRRRANPILAQYQRMKLPHRCRVVIITDYMSDDEMLELTRASTYYVTSTRAEGNCLPLMNYLAAGRPAVSPCHTAIADYFNEEMGLVVESHPEPCAWPHDPLLRTRTTWQRLVWPSLVEAFRESYRVARRDTSRYEGFVSAARAMSWQRHHPTRVLPQLHAALETVGTEGVSAQSCRAAA
jgi:glycosyltransferase involved in cell wall biosynthesis